MLNHGEANKVVIVDPEFSGVMKKALEIAKKDSGREFLVIDVEENEFDVPGERLGKLTYEKLLAEGDPHFAWQVPADEWQAICLNTPLALPVILKGWCITIGVQRLMRYQLYWIGILINTQFTCGRYPCFTAMAGAFRRLLLSVLG